MTLDLARAARGPGRRFLFFAPRLALSCAGEPPGDLEWRVRSDAGHVL